jgi:glycosyltransferase involved in cell wall biosynthesis
MSAIARFSRDITARLAEIVDVDLWVFERGDLFRTSLPLIPFTPDSSVIKRLSEYDHVIYNMGNYAGYHKAIYEVFTKHPGVVILHDFVMHNFFMQIYLDAAFSENVQDGQEAYVRDMEILYGRSGREAAERSVAGINPIWFSDDVIRFPFFEKLTSLATGVFVHSYFHRQQVEKYFSGPVENAYLPFVPNEKILHSRSCLRQELFPQDDRLRVVSTGIVHPCKRIHSVIEVLRDHPELKQEISYYVIGQSGGPYEEHLTSLINKYHLSDVVYMLGYQPSETMYKFLAVSDFCVNLRFPNSEGCSLSLIEQMAYENPVICLDTGMYKEVPAECALKVRLNYEKQDLGSALKRLVMDNELRQLMSKAAARWTRTECSMDSYSDRLIKFLGQLPEKAHRLGPPGQVVRNVARALVSVGLDVDEGPVLAEQVSMILEEILCKNDRNLRLKVEQQRVLGVWLGFSIRVGLRREGITRYLVYLIKHLVDNYHVKVEIWCYSINYDEILISFGEILQDAKYSDYIKVIHEDNYDSIFGIERDPFEFRQRADPELDDLAVLANQYSHAECFLAAICYLDNLIAVDRPLFVPVHDLVLHERYYDFLDRDPNNVLSLTKVRKSIEAFYLRGSFFYCNSDYVRRNHLLKYFPEIGNASVVYLPANLPKDVQKNIFTRHEMYSRHKIRYPYLFYPTQLRPHKNIPVLVRALNRLVVKGYDIKLVLTGNIEDCPSLQEDIHLKGLNNYVLILGDVPEKDLYSLYHHCAATVVTTLFEGGFPWQALEALAMNAPVVLSRIPVVEERLRAEGFEPEVSGLLLFDPFDHIELADKILLALADRDGAVHRQSRVREKLLAYTWDEVSHQCFEMFFGRRGTATRSVTSMRP